MPRVFLDSNIWFPAFYHSENCEKLLIAGAAGKITVVISQQVLKEVVKNIREKKPDQLANFQDFILETPLEITADPEKISPKLTALVSPEDLPIFQSAVNAKVNFFVTGNTRDFSIKKLEKHTGVKILTPKQAISALRLE